MRCRANDLCFFIGGLSECPLEAFAVQRARDRIVRVTHLNASRMWVFERPIVVPISKDVSAHILAAADEFLRPIRPGDGADETIRWAGLPEPEVTDETIAEALEGIRRELDEESPCER